MKRDEVYHAINSERDFQEEMKGKELSHIVEDFPLGSALSAIQHKLETARNCWYRDKKPYKTSMDELRKIAAIVVQMGEKYGMSER